MPTRTSDDVERLRLAGIIERIGARHVFTKHRTRCHSGTIHAGRNRQVRRMCAAVGHPVRRLVRTRIGPLRDQHLAPGVAPTVEAELLSLQRGVSART